MRNSALCMPKQLTNFQAQLTLRVPTKSKDDLLEINPNYAIPLREAIDQYLPVRKLLMNPLSVPRILKDVNGKIEFSVSEEGNFQISINDQIKIFDYEELRIMLANIFMHTLNSPEV